MKKRIFVVAVCALVLCGCGSSTASGSADSAVSDAVEAAADIACIVGIIAKIAALKTKKFSAGYVHMNSISTGVYQCTGCIKHGAFKLLYRVRRI